jgi:transcriptional regulator with XRE-family HTH domain
MKNQNNIREKLLNTPSYWVEGINGLIYDAVVTYMEKHDMKRKDLAKHLDVSNGRVSQLLNEGDINFSLEKLNEIAIKVDKYPNFLFEDKKDFVAKERRLKDQKSRFYIYNFTELSTETHSAATLSGRSKQTRAKVIALNPTTTASESFDLMAK